MVTTVHQPSQVIISTEILHKLIIFLTGSLVPGCARTYQEVCTEYTRDFMIQQKTDYAGLTASLVVGEIIVGLIRFLML